MTKLNVTYPAVNVLVNGVEYRKVDRKAQAGDIVKAKVDAADVEAGAFYAIRTDADGDVFFIDGGGDRRYYYLMDGRAEVYEPVTQRAATSAAEITFEGPDGVATYRKVDRDARVDDVIVFTDEDELPDYLTLGRPYIVTEIDSTDDAQITDDDGDDYDTCGKTFDVYEKVSGAVAEATTQQYREVKRWAEKGERIRIVNREPGEDDYAVGAEFIVNDTDGDGDVRVKVEGTDRKLVLLREYAVLEPMETPETYVHDGVTYRRESRVANVGELVLVVANTMSGNEHGYKIGEVTEIIGEWTAGSYGPQRRGSGIGGPYLATADYVVLVPVEAARPEPLTVGDYVKVTRNSVGHNYEIGSVVKIAQITAKDTDGNDEFRAEKADGLLGNYIRVSECEPATETEFLAQRKPKDPRDTFAKGDKVRLISGGGEFPLYGFANGTVYEVDTPKYDTHHSHNGVIKIVRDGGNQGYAKPEQIAKLTAEEAAAIEKERAETEKWAEIGRKVGEFKRGDLVRVVNAMGASAISVNQIVEVAYPDGTNEPSVRTATGGTSFARVSMVVPVEQRFDTDGAAKSAA